MSAGLRERLRELGFNLIEAGGAVSPAVITLVLPPELNSVEIGAQLQENGFLLSCNSDYLQRKNWIQICLMGEIAREKLVSLANALQRVCRNRQPAPNVVN
jgi:aspartate aminotransferase-like enzyme